MKVLHINTSDSSGGAAIAAFRLHSAMLSNGINSTYLCLNKTKNDDINVITIDRNSRYKSQLIDFTKSIFFNKFFISNTKIGLFSNMEIGLSINKIVDINSYDIIYIHWINNSFISLKGLKKIIKSGKKIFWFLHDMFPITGGCHHSFDCSAYQYGCGNCIYLKNRKKYDFSHKQLFLKKIIINNKKNFSFISPSKWLYECALKSPVTKGCAVYQIPNLLNPRIYNKLNMDHCREVLGLPKDKKLILFGADYALINPYKGFSYLQESLNILKNENLLPDCNINLVVFGSSYNREIEKQLPYPVIFMGYLHDSYTLNALYNASDVFCIPSLAEAFGQTALEAIFTHTPVVGFDIGGIPDIINSNVGYLAKYKDSHDFANGIAKCLTKNDFNFYGIEKFNQENVLNEHIKIWENNN